MADVLYIHPLGQNPSFSLKYFNKENNQEHFFGFIPMGIIGIVNNLIKNKISVAGINLPLKQRINPSFSLDEYIKKLKPKIILIDMHWYVHIKNGLEIAKLCNELGCKVIVGGLSATLFYKQLLEFECIDYVVKGDAELPILELILFLLNKKSKNNIKKINNIASKESDNEISYICTDINNYDYTNIDFLEDKEAYLKMFDFWLMVGKGCPFNCENCDGARHRTEGIFGRNRTIFRTPEKIIDDLQSIESETVGFSLDLDILPAEVIDAISKKHFDLNLRNEFFQLCNVENLKKIKNSFNSFDLVFSPTSGDDKERYAYGKKFTNNDFLNNLKEIKKLDIIGGIIIYFTDYMISPIEVRKLDVDSRNNLIKKIKNIFPEAIIEVLPQVVDPGSVKIDKDKLFELYSG